MILKRCEIPLKKINYIICEAVERGDMKQRAQDGIELQYTVMNTPAELLGTPVAHRAETSVMAFSMDVFILRTNAN